MMRLRPDLDARFTGPEPAPVRDEPHATGRVQSRRPREEAMLWTACAVVLTLLWALILVVGAGRAELKQRHRADLAESAAKGFSEYVGLNLLIADRVLFGAREHYARTGNILPLADVAADLGPMSGMLLQISAADARGKLIASSLPLEPGVSIADRPHFLEFLQNPRDRLHLGQPVVGRVSKRMSLQLVRPLLGPTGEFRGVMVASIAP